jgi:hypothetical protein
MGSREGHPERVAEIGFVFPSPAKDGICNIWGPGEPDQGVDLTSDNLGGRRFQACDRFEQADSVNRL